MQQQGEEKMIKKQLLTTIVAAAILFLPGNLIRESAALSRFCGGAVPERRCGETDNSIPTAAVSQRQLLPGTADETALHIIEGAEQGPTVLIIGGIHGDEPAGAAAAELIATWAIDRGTLLVLPRANPRALIAGSRCAPGCGDLNRAFPGGAGSGSCGQLAAAIYDVMDCCRPQWVLDLHEAPDYEKTNPGALGQTIIYPRGAASLDIVSAVMERANAARAPFQGPFLLRRGAVRGGTIHAAVGILGLEGFLVESCRKMPLEQRVQEHTRVVAALLEQLGMTPY